MYHLPTSSSIPVARSSLQPFKWTLLWQSRSAASLAFFSKMNIFFPATFFYIIFVPCNTKSIMLLSRSHKFYQGKEINFYSNNYLNKIFLLRYFYLILIYFCMVKFLFSIFLLSRFRYILSCA